MLSWTWKGDLTCTLHLKSRLRVILRKETFSFNLNDQVILAQPNSPNNNYVSVTKPHPPSSQLNKEDVFARGSVEWPLDGAFCFTK